MTKLSYLKPNKVWRIAKRVKHKLRNRTVSNFYKGQSLPRTIYKGGRFVIKHGPKTALSIFKHGLVSDGIVRFPNGLVSDVDLARIRHWFKQHGKKVTVVIPSYNDFPLLKNCLDSLAQTVKAELYNVIVVDDYCQPENRNKLKSLKAKNVSIIFREENGGFGKAVNTGFREALKLHPRQDVVLLNSDIVAHADWLACLQHGAYEFDKSAGIVGPKLLYPDGTIQSGGSHRNTELPEWFDHYYRFKPSEYGPANIPQYCIGVTGACMYIKSSTMKKLGLLDERFPFAFEDMDYCVRAWDEDIKVLYYPAATLTHVESATRGKDRPMTEREKESLRFFLGEVG